MSSGGQATHERRRLTEAVRTGGADEYDASTGNYTQTVSLNGAVVSTLSTSDGYAEGWGSAVECAASDCGTVPAHGTYGSIWDCAAGFCFRPGDGFSLSVSRGSCVCCVCVYGSSF